MSDILDLTKAIDTASEHLWTEMNSPVNKTPYANYAEFKAKDPIGEDEFAAIVERTLRAAQGQQTTLKAALKAELFDRSAEIDPDDDHLWTSMIIGWGIAKGMSIADATRLANEPWPT